MASAGYTHRLISVIEVTFVDESTDESMDESNSYFHPSWMKVTYTFIQG
jgi:hypothetical protein